MLVILRREIFEDEPAGMNEIPGVPDVVQRKRHGGGAEVRAAVIWPSLVNIESCDELCVWYSLSLTVHCHLR